MAIIGNRKGDRDLMACYHDGKDYVLEVLDHNVGPANTRVYKKPGNKLGILSTNRETVSYTHLAFPGGRSRSQ